MIQVATHPFKGGIRKAFNQESRKLIFITMETKANNSVVEIVNTSPNNNPFNILNSYNALTLTKPQDVLTRTNSIIGSDIDVRTTGGTSGVYSGVYTECQTEEEVDQSLSISLGVTGQYELYSGSFKGTFSTSYQQRDYSFNSKYVASIDYGTAEFGGSNAAILGSLESSLQNSLNSITTFNDAKTFVDEYGTHVITKVSRGGTLYIGIQANSTTEVEKTNINAKVSGAYNGAAGGVSATVGVIDKLATEFSQYNLTQKIFAVGGNPFVGNQKDTSGLENWASSVAGTSVRGIIEAIPFWKLDGVPSAASSKLENYVKCQMLIHSLENPLIVSNTGTMTAGQISSISTKTLPHGFKLVGGGAATQENSANFLVSSYPKNLGKATPQQWIAEAHDCIGYSNSTDIITSYGVAIYDPFDLVQVHVSTSSKSSTTSGNITILQPYYNPDNIPYPIVTGGGLKTTLKSGSFVKYMVSNVFQWNGWNAVVNDYKDASTDIQLDAYAITISIPSGIVTAMTHFTSDTGSGVEVSINTPVTSGKRIIGGGSGITAYPTSGGNLYQQCFPNNDSNALHSYSKDPNQSASASEVTRALYLEANFVNMNS